MQIQEAQTMFIEEMTKWGLQGWVFLWDSSSRRFGCCYWTKKKITMSQPLVLLNSREQCLDTIRHEIAHALTPRDHHGYQWRLACLKVGANPKRCYDSSVAQPPKPYEWYCPVCGKGFYKYYTFVDPKKKYCQCQKGKAIDQIIFLKVRYNKPEEVK